MDERVEGDIERDKALLAISAHLDLAPRGC